VIFFLVVAAFFSAASLVAGHYIWAVPERQAARALGHRLREVRVHARGRTRSSPELLRREHRGAFAFLGDLVTWAGLLRRLQELIEQANLRYRAADVFGVSVLLAASVFGILALAGGGNWIIGLILAALVGTAPLVYILRVRRRGLGKRVPLIDLKFFITSLILQRQTGANMVAVLENLAALVRERLDMAEKLKAHTAQQRLSAWLLCALPLVVGLGFYIQKPEYVRLLWTDPTGAKFLTYGVVSEIVGILIIRRIASVRV
jgi:Flp pilus assembly protein TadB